MKKVKLLLMAAVIIGLFSCGGGKETPESIAEEWCELDKAVSQATSEEEEEAAREKRDAFEEKMQEKYADDEAFMDKVGAAVEACEGEGY